MQTQTHTRAHTHTIIKKLSARNERKENRENNPVEKKSKDNSIVKKMLERTKKCREGMKKKRKKGRNFEISRKGKKGVQKNTQTKERNWRIERQ